MVRGGRDPGSEAEAGYRQILNLAVPAFLSWLLSRCSSLQTLP